ncbi:MAG: DUF6088 family protein [Candidatus Dadabacteria bacterium]|nr:DUF6088 family protein [Candidatus Dadabacteria bacterium]
MSIARAVQENVEKMPAGRIFGYRELPDYLKSPGAVIKTVNRMVSDGKIERFSKGRFYVSKKGLLGPMKPSDGEIIRSMLYKDGRLCGYVTGPYLYNWLGLTTQMSRVVTVACKGSSQKKEFGTIRVDTVVSRIPIKEKDVPLLQYLDALKDIRKIQDSDIDISLEIIRRRISELSDLEQLRLASLAKDYYPPRVRALVCLLFSRLQLSVPDSLVLSLNPLTTYKLKLDQSRWPEARKWNIR